MDEPITRKQIQYIDDNLDVALEYMRDVLQCSNIRPLALFSCIYSPDTTLCAVIRNNDMIYTPYIYVVKWKPLVEYIDDYYSKPLLK